MIKAAELTASALMRLSVWNRRRVPSAAVDQKKLRSQRTCCEGDDKSSRADSFCTNAPKCMEQAAGTTKQLHEGNGDLPRTGASLRAFFAASIRKDDGKHGTL
jgi:hypothetical protein